MAEAVTTIENQQVEVTELPTALSELWSQIETSDNVPISRALTLNLIAVTDAQHEDQLCTSVNRLLLRHPCRAFIVVLDDSERGEVRAEIGASIRCGKKSRQTQLEEVTLRAPRSSFAAIPSVIRPLVVNDIPVHLYWATTLPKNTWDLTTMARIADQTIVYSCSFADPVGDLQRLEELPEISFKDLAQIQLRPGDGLWHLRSSASSGTPKRRRRSSSHTAPSAEPAPPATCCRDGCWNAFALTRSSSRSTLNRAPMPSRCASSCGTARTTCCWNT